MEKNKSKNKIRVWDQWFYFIEDCGKAIYNTEAKEKPKKKQYMKLINDENATIIEWWKGKKMARRLFLNKRSNTCIYEEYLPETIYVEKIPKSDILINYIETKVETKDNSKISTNYTFRWKNPHEHEQKKMTKKIKKRRKHLKEDLSKNIDCIESKQKLYVEQLIKYLKAHLDDLEYKTKEIKEEETEVNVDNLNIPGVIDLVDRRYKLIKYEPDHYTYSYKDKDSARIVEISDLNGKYQIQMNIECFKTDSKSKEYSSNIGYNSKNNEADSKPKKYSLNIGYNNKNILVSRFETVGKSDIIVEATYSGEKGSHSILTELNDIKFSKKTTYEYNESKGKYDAISNVKIKTEDDQYILKSTNTLHFFDKNDTMYHLSGCDYGMLDQISMLSQGIYNNIEETFSKVKQK